MANKLILNSNFNGEYEVLIKHKTSTGYSIISPIVEDGVKWETDRQGSPGKLTFKVYQDDNGRLNFQEGDAVALRYRKTSKDEWIAIFTGYVFTKKRSKDNWLDVTAYDQLRYFKNKDTYVYKEKRASDIVRMIAEDYGLNIGTIENTDYVISERVEDNQTLFDIVQNALDLTISSTSNHSLYVLYDNAGKLYLRNVANLKYDGLLITESTAEDFDYQSSIDEETYNEIELYYDNDETNKREYFFATDKDSIGDWGRLRYTESLNEPSNAKVRAEQMLKLYNRKTKNLKVKKAFGDYHCRAGWMIPVQLDLGDTTVNNYMVIEKATHTFTKDEYRMDLTLSDSEFSA